MAGHKKRDGPLNYFELPRKQLQSLCKKYSFPANKTNLLMAEFLTAHLNSEEYLDRDMSFPSPTVKTRFQCRDEEAPTDDDTPTISESAGESEPVTLSETEAMSVPQHTCNIDVQQTDHPLEASTAEGEGLGEVMKIGSEDVEGSLPSKEETKDCTPSSFRIRETCPQFQGGSGQDTSVPAPNTEEATDSGSGHPSTLEETMDFTTTSFASLDTSLESQKAQRLETPLPLSVMPYVRAVTPGSGVKLFVDLQSEGLAPAENPRDYYGTWGGQLSSNAAEMLDEVILGSSKTSEGSERRSLPILVSDSDKGPDRADREAEDGGELASTSSKKADAVPLKSCLLLTPKRKPSPQSVSFLCPPISSPRAISGSMLDAERSVIVKEWNADQIDPLGGVVCSELEKAANGELLKNIDETLPATESSELNIIRTSKSTVDVESPPEQAVKIHDEKRLSTGPSSMQRSVKRRESYKASPMFKSSRIAAELERASKVRQTKRFGLLALKRAMAVTPLFSDSPEVAKESRGSASSTTPVSDSVKDGVAVGTGSTSTAPHVLSPDSMAIEIAGTQRTGVAASDMDVAIQNHSSPVAELLVPGEGFQNDDAMMSNEGIAEKDEEIVSEMDTNGHETEESEGAEGNDDAMMSNEGIAEKDEDIVSEMDTNVHETEECEGAEGDEGVGVPAAVGEAEANLSWMTKPIQLPTRQPGKQKLREKPGRPFSANGRTLELMERASAKLKMMKKGAADRGEAASSRSKTSTSTTVATADPELLQIRGGEHVEPVCEVTIAESVAEHPVPELETAADNISPSTSSQLEMGDSPSSPKTEKGNSYVMEDDTSEESSYEALIRNGTTSIVPDEQVNVSERSDAIESVFMESQRVSEEDSTKTQHTAAQKPAAALSFLDIDFTKIGVPKASAGPQPEITLEIDSAKVGERIAAEKSTHPLSRMDSNRRVTDATTDHSPNPSSPAKPYGVLDGLSEGEEKNNNNGFSPYGKENEWSRRQEQHKTPLTGRSKEKALRTAETKASNLREQLLKKRRGMMDQLTDAENDLVASIQAIPLTQLATNRLS